MQKPGRGAAGFALQSSMDLWGRGHQAFRVVYCALRAWRRASRKKHRGDEVLSVSIRFRLVLQFRVVRLSPRISDSSLFTFLNGYLFG